MKTFLATFVFLLLPLASLAQKYHDAQAFGLKGHVKESVVTSKDIFRHRDPYGYRQIEFDKDGRLIFYDYSEVSNVKRSSDGYLSSFECYGSYHVKYDINHRAVEVGRDDSASEHYLYDNSGRLIKTSITDPDFKATGTNLMAMGTTTIKTSSYDAHKNFLAWQDVNYEGKVVIDGKRVVTYWDSPSTSKDNYKMKDVSKIAFFNTVKVQKVFNVVARAGNNPVNNKFRLVYTAPKGTTTNEVTHVYLVSYGEEDDNPSHIPSRVNGLIHHDLGKDKQFLGIQITSRHYESKYDTKAEWIGGNEMRLDDDETAQYLLDLRTDDTEWVNKTGITFSVTKDPKLQEYNKVMLQNTTLGNGR